MRSLNAEERRNIVLQAEGQALFQAGQSSVDHGADLARLQIDGLVNALIRMEGAEKTAAYVFALSDRCAGGLRMPTDFQMPVVAPAADTALPEPRKPEQST